MKVKPGTLHTMNDMDNVEIFTCRDQFVHDNHKVLSLYFSSLDLHKLKHTFISKFFKRANEVDMPPELLERSEFRFSTSKIIIPKSMNLVCKLLTEAEQTHSGVFRVNSVPENINSFISVVDAISTDKIHLSLGLKMIGCAFDSIDIAEAYKVLFRKCGSSIIPTSFLHMASRMADAKSDEHKKICCRAILFGLPKQNRMILENCIYICTFISAKLAKTATKMHLDLNGLAVVMTPNLINFNIEDLEFDLVKKLSEFILFTFENFQEIFVVDE